MCYHVNPSTLQMVTFMPPLPDPNPLRVLGTYVSETARDALTELIHQNYALPRDRAAQLLLDVLSWMRSAKAPNRFTRDPDKLAARRETLLTYLRAGASNAEIAAVLGVSLPRVSQLVSEARAEGVELPKRARGRPVLEPTQVAAILDLLKSGHTVQEARSKVDCTSAAFSRALAVLRKRGSVLPDVHKVQVWRNRLDAATAEAETLRRGLETRSFENYASTPEKAAAMEAEMVKKLAHLIEVVRELKATRPEGVETAPPKSVRVEAEAKRAAAAEAAIVGLDVPHVRKRKLKEQGKKPTPTPAPLAPPAPRPPVPANPLAAPQDAPKFGSLFQQMEEAQRARAEARAKVEKGAQHD